MRKIPTLFVRDFEHDNGRYVTREVTPECEWVQWGEGRATRKFDGTCVMFDGGRWWARREVKAGKATPADFVPLGTDDTTGKTVGWEPIEASGFAKFHAEAIENTDEPWEPGTYELCGPKINGNPEVMWGHVLVPHGQHLLAQAPRDYDGLHRYLWTNDWEGIVWHHDDGRMVKIKRRDFQGRPAGSGR